MPEDTTTPVDPPAGDTGNPQPDAATTPTNPPAGGSQNNEEPLSLEEARKIRSESTNLRKRLKDSEALAAELKAFKEQIEASQLSDKEKQELASKKLQEQLATLQKERDDATTRYQEFRTTMELERAARRIGATNENHIADAIRLIDRAELDFNENGTPTNAEKLLKKFAESHDWLTQGKSVATSGGATNPSRSQSSGNPSAQELANRLKQNRLSREEYTALPIETRMEMQKYM